MIKKDFHVFSETQQRHLDFLFGKTNSPVKVHSLIEIPLPRHYLMLVMIRGQPGVKGLIPMATRLEKKNQKTKENRPQGDLSETSYIGIINRYLIH